SELPDFELLDKLVNNVSTPVILEGKVWNLSDIEKAFKIGAYSVVIGSSITRPHLITRRFCSKIFKFNN
ncbi:MAG: N-acetylmannosamine-6-phosphate 2-epimerase, partial [Candidatus Woesearchaeota archaeon]